MAGSPRNRVCSRVRPVLIGYEPPFITDSWMRIRLVRVREHVRAIRGERQLEERPGEGVAGLDESEETARGEIEPLQRAPDVADDLAHQPVIAMRVERPIDVQHGLRIARGAQENRADLGLVQPQPEKRIVELAKRPQRPRLIACLLERVRRVGLRACRGR